MSEITITNCPLELEKALRKTAETRGISIDKAAVHLMQQGAGLEVSENDSAPIGNALDAYFGTWTREEADDLREAIRTLDQANDAHFWK